MNAISTSADEGCGDNDVNGLNLDVDPVLAVFLEKFDALQNATAVPMDLSQPVNNVAALRLHSKFDPLHNPPPPQKKLSWDQRRREEICRLREEVNALAERLKVYEFQGSLATGSVVFQSSVPAAKEAGGTSTWERLAVLELTHLQRNLEQNDNLRKSVEHLRQEIKAIQRALKIALQEMISSCETGAPFIAQ